MDDYIDNIKYRYSFLCDCKEEADQYNFCFSPLFKISAGAEIEEKPEPR